MDHHQPLLMVLIFKYFSFASSTGVCNRITSAESNSRVFYFTKTFCCDNYEYHVTLGCIECSIGLTSKSGSKCTLCPNNSYGFKCARRCNCQQQQSFRFFHTVTYNLYQITSTEVLNKGTDWKTETASTTINSLPTVTIDHINDKTKDAGQLFSRTAIYCTLAGSVIFIIGLVLCLSYISWKKNLGKSKRMHDVSSSIAQQPQVAPEVLDRQSEISVDNDYEEIDEENLIRELVISDHETSSINSSTTKSAYGGTDIDGYLHSYHSLVTENHRDKTRDEGTESTSEDIDIYEYKQYQKMSESVEEQDAFV